jgi:hypothetical protein
MAGSGWASVFVDLGNAKVGNRVSPFPRLKTDIFTHTPLLFCSAQEKLSLSLSLHSFNSKRYPFSNLHVQYLPKWQQQFSSLFSPSLSTMKSWPLLPSPRTLLATVAVVTVVVLQKGVKPVVEGTLSSMTEMA